MAIRDLLWVCPECGLENGLQRRGRNEVCRGCGTRYRRGAGASIVAFTPGKPPVARSAQEWMRLLPAAEIGEAAGGAGGTAPRTAPALLRRSIADKPIYVGNEVVGFMERFGPAVEGTLRLGSDAIVFEKKTTDPSGDADVKEVWPLADITSVQPSSRTVQLKLRNEPIISLRFPGGSPRVWEELIVAALRAYYHRTGQGEIREFQPRIVVRATNGKPHHSSSARDAQA